ncbi:MAG: hypothetical protein ACHQNV_03020 [Vicinamibacteria bacterium]
MTRESRWWLALSLALITVAAIQSDGFHHPDEYFQTLEFAGAKLGRTPLQDLPWEYTARIRSWLQPGLYYALANAWAAIGVEDPFAWTLSFRLLSGFLGWLAVLSLVLCVPRWFPGEEARRVAVRVLCLAWFVPYLAVRTSSESLAASCLTLALSLLVLTPAGSATTSRDTRVPTALAGVLFGLAFEFRFAVGIAAAGAIAWAAFVARIPLRRLSWLVAGVAVVVLLVLGIDRWGYGEWVFPPHEYLFVNLVEGAAAQRFGSLPWYGYASIATEGPAAPLVLILMAVTVVAWLRRPLHLLTWATAPFVVVHVLVAHKELRFLFPMATLSLVLAVLAFAPLGDRWDRRLRPLWEARRHPVARVVVGLNLVALAVFCLTPTQPQIGFQRFVWQHHPKHFEGYLLTPFSPWVAAELPMHFYRPEELHLHPVASVTEVEALGLPRFLLITGSFDAPEPPASAYRCTPLYVSLPYWLREVAGHRVEAIPAWNLYRCVPKVPPE